MTFVLHLHSCREKNDDVEDQHGAVDDESVDGIGQKVSHLLQCVVGVGAVASLPLLPGLLCVGLRYFYLAAVSQVDKDKADDVEREEDDGGDAVEEDVKQVADLPLDDVPRALGLQPILSQNLLTEVVAHELLLTKFEGGLDPWVAGVISSTILKIVHQ